MIGVDRFYDNLKSMFGYYPSVFFKFSWVISTPALSLVSSNNHKAKSMHITHIPLSFIHLSGLEIKNKYIQEMFEDTEAVNRRTEITMAKRYRSYKSKDRDHNDQQIQKL